ncbi:MAG: glutathione S-transferase [Pseudomonadota bacterium]
MKLYAAAASPFVRKVQVCLHETGLIDKVEIVPVSGHPTDAGTMPVSQNPLGKIPTLERPEGPAIYDSRAICQYVNDLADHTLYPKPPRLWETLTLEATADGIMDAAVLMVYEGRSRAEGMQDATWLEAQWSKIDRALNALEGRWLAHLKGPLDAGVIAVACALGYLDFRHAARDWRATRPALAEWEKGFADRDSMQATQPQG